MDFTFSAEQDALRDAVRAFLGDWVGRTDAARRWPARSGARSSTSAGPDSSFRSSSVGSVWASSTRSWCSRRWDAPPSRGRISSSAVVAAVAARRLGLDDLLREVAGGATGTVALEESGHGDPVTRVRTRARRRGATWLLSGEKPLVLDVPGAAWALVAARTADGLATFRIDDPRGEPIPTMDETRIAGRLVLSETAATPVGRTGDQTAIWRAIVDDTAVVLAAELTGVCDAAIDMAMHYAQHRVQFDRPIASHQVIQHKLVDMLHATELARVGVHYAAWASDTADADASRAASIAKSQAGDAAVMVTAENIQVHGAVGFTWDSRAGVLYQRAKQNDVLGGGRSWHRGGVADLVLDVG